MQAKTEGKCAGCGGMYTPVKGSTHLLVCADVLKILRSDAKVTEGYYIHIVWAEYPDMYWMILAIPKNLTLAALDEFLRNEWLECCGHLSEFVLGVRRYMSHTESGDPSQSMQKTIGQVFSPGDEVKYVYDMGSSTNLTLHVLKNTVVCPHKKVTLLMQNEPPLRSCTTCQKQAQIICSFCGETICRKCGKQHACAVQEGDVFMLMPLVNSPRAGVCGYEGKEKI